MSHYSLGVILTKEQINEFGNVTDENAVFAAVSKAMNPFDESLTVEPHLVKTIDELSEERNEILSYEGNNEFKLKLKKEYQNTSLQHFCEDFYEYEYREDGAYSTYNENSKWDWYVVGGRFANQLPMKNIIRPYGKADQYVSEVKGNMCKIKDIQIKKELTEEEIEEYKKFYFNEIEGKGFYKPEYILSKYPTFEDYLEQQSQFSTYALLTSDGIWHEPGRMGWFGCSTATSEDEIKYENEYKEKVLAEDPESYFVMVDCHI